MTSRVLLRSPALYRCATTAAVAELVCHYPILDGSDWQGCWVRTKCATSVLLHAWLLFHAQLRRLLRHPGPCHQPGAQHRGRDQCGADISRQNRFSCELIKFKFFKITWGSAVLICLCWHHENIKPASKELIESEHFHHLYPATLEQLHLSFKNYVLPLRFLNHEDLVNVTLLN